MQYRIKLTDIVICIMSPIVFIVLSTEKCREISCGLGWNL